MVRQNSLKMKTYKPIIIAFMVSAVLAFYGCGGGSGSSSGGGGDDDPVTPATWSGDDVLLLDAGGLLSPRIKIAAYNGTSATVMFFEDSDTGGEYDIKQVVYQMGDTQTSETSEPETVITVDNCGAISATVNANGDFLVGYRGGVPKVCGDYKQADAMFSVSNAGAWEEYTGAIGFVERNDYFEDGYVNGDMSMVTDSDGNIHMCFQFMYEGCDAMNFTYPDLNYIMKSAGALAADVPEEQVEGSFFYPGGGVQNSVGYHCQMILDNDENPVIFYYAVLADDSFGLRMARKISGEWVKSWVETDVTVGAISCTTDAAGNIGVAYYVTNYIDPYNPSEETPACLRYAQNTVAAPETWTVAMVDDSSLCGKYPSLAFDSSGTPAIAYYDVETYTGYDRNNLKMATYGSGAWIRETVAETGDIGWYNTLWFDEEDLPYICTYSQSEKRIYIYHKS